MKLAVIGAGSTYTPEIMEGLIQRKQTLPVSELVLYDIDERKLRIVGGLIQRMTQHELPQLMVRLSMDLEDTLSSASFVIAQIRVGKLPARHLDESIPLSYGLIGQETTGMGGFFNGLRTIPVLIEIARKMERICPQAWLINFSNPSGMVMEALHRHTAARAIGLCNIPINTLRDIRTAVNDPEATIETVGLNHFSYVTSVISHGQECLNQLIEEGYCGEKPKNLPQTQFDKGCLRACGGLPNGYLIYYYMRDTQLKKLQDAPKTRAQICMEIEESLLRIYADTSVYQKPELLNRRGGHLYSEAAISLISSIFNDDGAIHTVNTPHLGVIPYLRANDVAEIACRVDRTGPHPLPIKEQGTPHMKQMIQTLKAFEHLAVQAAVYGDRDAAVAAMLTHPLIGDYPKAMACFTKMLQAHQAYLPQFGNL